MFLTDKWRAEMRMAVTAYGGFMLLYNAASMLWLYQSLNGGNDADALVLLRDLHGPVTMYATILAASFIVLATVWAFVRMWHKKWNARKGR